MLFSRKRIKKEFNRASAKLQSLEKQIIAGNVLQANILHSQHKANHQQIIKNIQLAEFKVFSQWGDDGIIQFLIDYLDIDTKTFIEFGVEDYTEANTRFLLINNNWAGLIMDGSEIHMQRVKQDDFYWQYQLTAIPAYITAENINQLITQNGFSGEVGLLSIDIDGVDYWVWKAIDAISPVIVIAEYNSVFGGERALTVPYKANFYRKDAHFSNLYFGASVPALCDLAEEKGYVFIGCNSHGNNAYFVRKDKLKDLVPQTAANAFVTSRFRESRDANGNLTYINGAERVDVIKGLDIYNTRTNTIEKI